LSIFNFAPEQLSGATCLADLSAYQKLGLAAAIPMVFVLELLATMLVHYAYRRFKLKKRSGFPWPGYSRAFLALYLSSYTAMVSQS
jgi:hypothetical protein